MYIHVHCVYKKYRNNYSISTYIWTTIKEPGLLSTSTVHVSAVCERTMNTKGACTIQWYGMYQQVNDRIRMGVVGAL